MELLKWKYPSLYLASVGIANISGWIYLLAINLMVLEMTGSALAIAGLYMIKPISHMIVGLWAGSIIDRVSLKHLMIALDGLRALLILTIPFLDSLWIIYAVVLFIQMAGAIFEPASFTYMTLLLPENDRKRFNAWLSFVHSGAFVIGPALAGGLFMTGSLNQALFVNTAAFLISAGLTILLPVKTNSIAAKNTGITLLDIRSDMHLVWTFSKRALPFVAIYMLFQGTMLMTAAIDSTEVAFAKEVLLLSDAQYGSLVSVAGIGFLMGAVSINIFAKVAHSNYLLGMGSLLVSAGYIVYSFSNEYVVAAIGFFILSFFLSIANTGFMTFIQTNIPLDMMGRISSLYGMASSSLKMVAILVMGLAANMLSIKVVVIGGSAFMFVIACYLVIMIRGSAASTIYE